MINYSFSKNKHYYTMPKANSKSSKQKTNKCSRCHRRHLPQTGVKCTRQPALEELEAQPDDDDFDTSLGEGTSTGINIIYQKTSSESQEAGPSNSIEGEIRNMTSVMLQILNRMDAQEGLITDLASKVENMPQPCNIGVDLVQNALPLAACMPSNPACSPTLQQYRADASLVPIAAQHINSSVEVDLGRSLGTQLPSSARSQKTCPLFRYHGHMTMC
jgi:hypothetical protein